MIRQQIVKLIHWSVMQRFLMVEKTLALLYNIICFLVVSLSTIFKKPEYFQFLFC